VLRLLKSEFLYTEAFSIFNLRRKGKMKKILIVTIAGICLAVMVIAGLTQLSDAAEIYGCVSNRTGALRIVSDVSQCTSKESPISWNQAGPQGSAGAAGHSPVVSMSGDQITVDGVITGPHLMGPEGPAGSISGISAMASAVVNADGSIWVASPGVSATRGDPGFYGITLPSDFQTVWPAVPVCTATALFDFFAYVYYGESQSTCHYDPAWAGTGPGATLYTNVKCFKGWNNIDSAFSIVCVK